MTAAKHFMICLLMLRQFTRAAIEDCRCWKAVNRRFQCRGGKGLAKARCESVGCCFDDATPRFAISWSRRCFEKDGSCPEPECQVSPIAREPCGSLILGGAWCRHQGCCFDDSRQKPTCFRKRIVRAAPEPINVKFRMTIGPPDNGPVVKAGELITAKIETERFLQPSTITFLTTTLPATTAPYTTTVPSTVASTFQSTSLLLTATPTVASLYYGPNGLYNLAGFTIFAQCPAVGARNQACIGKIMNRTSCYNHFCCWKEPGFCHLPVVRVLRWPTGPLNEKKEFLWSPWTTWSACPTDRCQPAEQKRYRECLTKSANGKSCDGRLQESQPCDEYCDAAWTDWGSWTLCTKACGPGIKRRARLCRRNDTLTPPFRCPGGYEKSQEKEDCNTDFCREWAPWRTGACPVTCGGAIAASERTCKEPAKNLGEPRCVARLRVCAASSCISPQPVLADEPQNDWGQWGRWSDCSNQCGSGTRRRRRSCLMANELDTAEDVESKSSCLGGTDTNSENEVCNADLCSTWSSWFTSKPCSASCGGGLKEMRRSCLQRWAEEAPQICSKTMIRCNVYLCPK